LKPQVKGAQFLIWFHFVSAPPIRRRPSSRRKFFDLHASNKSQIARTLLEQILRTYDIELEVKELPPDARQPMRQESSKSLLDALHQ
jgi:Transposase IS66 family